MTPAFVTKLLFACALGFVLALPAPSRAADACPLLRAQTDAPSVATRIAAAACEEHQLWYRPFIDHDGRYAGSRVREAETGLLANGQPAWLRVVDYWRGSGLLGSASGRPGASDCAYAGMSTYVSPSCRMFVVDTPWSAAFVTWIMRRARVPGFNGSASHVSYVRDAYRDPSGNAFQVANPVSARPQPGDLLCFVRAASRVYGFGGLAGLLSGNEAGLGMHCDIVVATNPDNDRTAYLVGGNILDGVTMRLLRLTPGGQFAELPVRSPEAPACSPDVPSACDASRQDWAVLLQLKSQPQLALLPPAVPMASPTTSRPQPECCVNCVVGSGIPRCPAGTPAPVRPLPPRPAPASPASPGRCCVNCVVGSGIPRCPAGTTGRP